MAGWHNTARSHAAPDIAGTLLALANRGLAVFAAWRFRVRSRRQLAVMDDHQLRDIGLDRFARDWEVGKPFWRR